MHVHVHGRKLLVRLVSWDSSAERWSWVSLAFFFLCASALDMYYLRSEKNARCSVIVIGFDSGRACRHRNVWAAPVVVLAVAIGSQWAEGNYPLCMSVNRVLLMNINTVKNGV